MREQLAQLAHEQWSGWIKHMFRQCEPTKNNELVIPRWAAERWTRQSETPYCELSEKEKDSDRAEADKFLVIIEQTLKEK